jgi:invasion protein IalB
MRLPPHLNGFRTRRRARALGALVALAVVAVARLAQAAPLEAHQEHRFGRWVVACQDRGTCYFYEDSRAVAAQQQPVFRLSIGALPFDRSYRFLLRIAPRPHWAADRGIDILVDGRRLVRLTLQTCDASDCVFLADQSSVLLDALLEAETVALRYYRQDNAAPRFLAIDTSGLRQAYDDYAQNTLQGMLAR